MVQFTSSNVIRDKSKTDITNFERTEIGLGRCLSTCMETKSCLYHNRAFLFILYTGGRGKKCSCV
jgi:hypothetical protein